MSLISELLSKLNHTSRVKGVPPGLPDTINAIKRKEAEKRRIIVLIAVVLGSASLGLAAIYLAGNLKDMGRPDTHAVQEASTLVPSSPDEPPRQPLTSNEKTVSTAPPRKALTPKKTRAVREPGTFTSASEKKAAGERAEQASQRSEKPAEALSGEHSREVEEKIANFLYAARTFEHESDYLRALESYKNVIRLDPGNYRVMNNTASILIKTDSLSEAASYLEKSLRLQENYTPALINMGIVTAKTGRHSDAEAYLIKAIAIEPANKTALLNLAVLYENRGEKEKAAEYYARLKALGDPEGAAGLKRNN